MRFRKTLKVAPGVKLNFSKRGVSTTIGPRGFSINSSSRGTFLNTGIPGTGLYSRKKLSGASGSRPAADQMLAEVKIFPKADLWAKNKSRYPLILLVMIVAFIFLFIQIFVGFFLLIAGLILLIGWMLTPAGKSTSLIRKGKSAYVNIQFTTAFEYLKKAYELYPNPHLIRPIISLAKDTGHTDTELKFLNLLDENDSAACMDRAECHFELGNYAEAALNYSKILGLAVTEADKDHIFSNYGICLFRIGNFNNAIEALQKVSVNYSNQSLLTLLIGECFLNIEEPASTILLFTDFLSHKRNPDPNMIEMSYILGQIYLKLADHAKAKHWLQKVYVQDIHYKDIAELLHSLDQNKILKKPTNVTIVKTKTNTKLHFM